jgi:peptidoglycan-associated lipoprotein
MKKLYFLILASMAVFLTAGCPTPKVEPTKPEPKVGEPVVEEPVVEEPVVEQKAVEEPVVEKKAAEEPVVEQKAAKEQKAVEEQKAAKEAVVEQKAAKEQKAAEEQKTTVLALVQKQELAKENAEIAVEQDADKSVEAPKTMTIISAPPLETDTTVIEMELVYFDYDKSSISPAFAEIIQNNYEWISENPNVQIQLEGHCDERGTNEYNLALGERRVQAVFDLLLSLGANKSQFTMVSFGEERPAVSDSNEFGWGKNRRVEFTRL